MKALGATIGVIGVGLCLLALFLWLLGRDACDTNCGNSDEAFVYFGLPGLVMAAVGLAIYRWSSRSA